MAKKKSRKSRKKTGPSVTVLQLSSGVRIDDDNTYSSGEPDTSFWKPEDLQDFVFEKGEGSWGAVLHLLQNAYESIKRTRPSVRRIVLTFPEESRP